MSSKLFTKLWTGRIDTEDDNNHQRIHQVVKPLANKTDEGGIALAGFASDLGVKHNQGRPGACDGPSALRGALANMAWHFDSKLYDAGNIEVDAQAVGDTLALAQKRYAKTVSQALNAQRFVLGLGGGHEIAWGSYQGCRQHLDYQGLKSANIGILNFDAHLDLRAPPPDSQWVGSSGTPFHQVSDNCQTRNVDFKYGCLGISQSSNTKALFEYALQHKVKYLLDDQCIEGHESETFIGDFIENIDTLYVTICLDALPAHIAPGVSAPAALGIAPRFIINSLRQIKTACHTYNVPWLMADIAELNPKYDLDNRTARIAARIAYEIISLQTTESSIRHIRS